MTEDRAGGLPGEAVSRALARFAEGDRAAFDEVFSLVWPVVQRFCREALKHADDGDDAAQVALEKVCFQASDYDADRPALPWVLAIAAWQCMTVRKQRQRRPSEPLAAAEGVASPGETPEQLLTDQELFATVESTLGQLSAADREVLRHAYFDELRLLGPADPAARKRKERALKRLKNLWRSLYDD